MTLDGNGHASATTNASWSPGLHNVVIKYLGDGSYMASSSNPVNFTIGTNLPGRNSTGIYNYKITQPDGVTSGYQANGNVQAYIDSVNGTWSNISYDGLNRLSAATQSTISFSQSMCWSYDSFGNRTAQMISGSPCINPPATVSYNANNQVQGFRCPRRCPPCPS
jgi:hypothetical protein